MCCPPIRLCFTRLLEAHFVSALAAETQEGSPLSRPNQRNGSHFPSFFLLWWNNESIFFHRRPFAAGELFPPGIQSFELSRLLRPGVSKNSGHGPLALWSSS